MAGSQWKLGYNTNGFAHHRLEDAAEILAEIGYRSLAVTLERDLIDPADPGTLVPAARRLIAIRERTGLALTIETGARFVLDPRRKHQPTLLSCDPAGRARRIGLLAMAIDLAAAVQANSVSLWSGAADDHTGPQELFGRLTESLSTVLRRAETAHVRLSFEPEPGMFIDTMAGFGLLFEAVRHPLFGLALDVGHLHCIGDGEVADHARRWRDVLWNVHLEDMIAGQHQHLMFGEGEMNFAEVFSALRSYDGPVHVELSRHSHNAVEAAGRAFEFLRAFA